jgi:superfamily II DNA or RNA helicase
MYLPVKDTIVKNLHQLLSDGDHGLREHQVEALQRVETFLRIPAGNPVPAQELIHDTPENGDIKKGHFFEVLSATGTGKTRMFGTMAKAMNVPTLIVTPRNVLNKQTKKEFCEEIGIPENAVAVYDSKQPAAERKRVVEGNPPPQFVITSYQSLPTLLERHELDITNPADAHYRPLVILDEVHESQGPKTLQTLKKLKDNVILAGFTATDAGVSESLFDGQKPIFKLPLVEAIDRGFLCHGIKTGTVDVKIDDAWVENFLKTPKGADYKREDVEKFARDPSVIEAAIRFHMTHEDEHLGKINRLPTLFYTEGVEAARTGADEFNKKAAEMGINAKAAYVSGDMTVKEYQPILDAFKRGEIQALWNDKLLGMGFDARNATVCYSLKPSRMPHVVEQQLGRVGRKEGDDYFEKYGQDKVALAINVRGKGMNPLLFGEVMEGRAAVYAGGYEPTSRKPGGTPGGYPEPKPEMPQGVDVHIDYSDMQAVLSKAIKERAGVPEKTEEWFSVPDMARNARKTSNEISSKYKSLYIAWKSAIENGEKNFTAEGITIPTDKAQLLRCGTNINFCLHKDNLIFFESAPYKTNEWLSDWDLSNKFQVSRGKIQPFYKELYVAWKDALDNDKPTFTVQNTVIPNAEESITIPTDKAGIFLKSSKTLFCVHQNAIELSDDKYMSMKESARRFNVPETFLAPIFAETQSEYEEAIKKGQETFYAYGSIKIPISKGKICENGAKLEFHLQEDIAELLCIPTRPIKFLDTRDMAYRTRITQKTLIPVYQDIEAAWKKAKEENENDFSLGKFTIPLDQAGIFRDGSNVIFSIHEDWAKAFRRSAASFAEQMGKRSITPDSDHLKHADRVRGKEE